MAPVPSTLKAKGPGKIELDAKTYPELTDQQKQDYADLPPELIEAVQQWAVLNTINHAHHYLYKEEGKGKFSHEDRDAVLKNDADKIKQIASTPFAPINESFLEHKLFLAASRFRDKGETGDRQAVALQYVITDNYEMYKTTLTMKEESRRWEEQGKLDPTKRKTFNTIQNEVRREFSPDLRKKLAQLELKDLEEKGALTETRKKQLEEIMSEGKEPSSEKRAETSEPGKSFAMASANVDAPVSSNLSQNLKGGPKPLAV